MWPNAKSLFSFPSFFPRLSGSVREKMSGNWFLASSGAYVSLHPEPTLFEYCPWSSDAFQCIICCIKCWVVHLIVQLTHLWYQCCKALCIYRCVDVYIYILMLRWKLGALQRPLYMWVACLFVWFGVAQSSISCMMPACRQSTTIHLMILMMTMRQDLNAKSVNKILKPHAYIHIYRYIYIHTYIYIYINYNAHHHYNLKPDLVDCVQPPSPQAEGQGRTLLDVCGRLLALLA